MLDEPLVLTGVPALIGLFNDKSFRKEEGVLDA